MTFVNFYHDPLHPLLLVVLSQIEINCRMNNIILLILDLAYVTSSYSFFFLFLFCIVQVL
jgi:hypothetical protein